MSSIDTMNRIIKKNKATKVSQLSEIASLFEREKRINQQVAQIEQFEIDLKLQAETNPVAADQLPRAFLKQENAKREKLIETLAHCKEQEIEARNVICDQKILKSEELLKIENCINSVEERCRRQNLVNEVTKEILESEDFLQVAEQRKDMETANA